jgi:predicted nucleic acid-binding protein
VLESFYELHRIDFADAYRVASAEVTGVGSVMSFDRDVDRIGTVVRVAP